jgi:heme/copper-type cytochrome/quinol oxidase subunit 1
VLLKLVMVAGVVLVALPALALGVRGLTRRSGHYSNDLAADRASLALVVAVRSITLLLVLALSGVTLLSAIGALIRGVNMPSLVSVFFVLDLLLASLVLLTFGRRVRRPARRRANPAAW